MYKLFFNNILITLFYFLFGEVGLLLAIPPGYASPIFPASAVGLIAVLQHGWKVLPGVFFGSLCINLIISSQQGAFSNTVYLVSASIAVGASIQAFVAARLVQYRIGDNWQKLINDSDIIWFLLLGSFFATLVSCTWANLSLLLAGFVKSPDLFFSWWNWWIGDSLGSLLFSPLLIAIIYRQQSFWKTRFSYVFVPVIIFFVALVSVFFVLSKEDYQTKMQEVAKKGEETIYFIKLELLIYQENINALARLFSISSQLSRADFDKYTSSIFETYPDIQALSWNPLITLKERKNFEFYFGKENKLTNFQITERDATQQLIPANIREWYVAVGYISPEKNNEKALGFDIASNPERMATILSAIQSGKLVATPPIHLVQDNGSNGLLLLQPVQSVQEANKTVKGFAVGVFKVEKMLKKLVEQRLPKNLLFKLEDLDTNLKSNLLYSNLYEGAIVESKMIWSTKLDFADRHWQISLYPTYQFLVESRSLIAWAILAMGLVVTGLLQAMLLGITGREFSIQQKVKAQTEDISEKNLALLAEKEKFENLLQASADGIHILDRDGYVREANPKFCEMLGYSYEEIIGMPVMQWEANFSSEEAVRKKLSENFDEANLFQTRHRCKNGNIIDVEVNSKTIKFNDEILLWNSSRDISERKEYEKRLLVAQKQAEEANQAKSAFLASMSHEIRTPMNAIVGLSSLALNKQVTPEIRDYLEKIYISSEGLLNILNDILDFAKLEAGRMTIEHNHFDLENVLANIHNLFAVRAEEKGLKLDVLISPQVPLHLIGDELRLQQILINLLGNAIKFTEQGSVTVKVDLVRSEASQAQLLFSVQDTGIGIADEDIEKLFKPFSQADGSITRRFGGTGLGLAISHNLLELMGSDIKIDSEVDKGTCFSFELVLCVSSDSTSLYHEIKQPKFEHRAGELSLYLNKPSHNLAGTSLLVVEDNKINQQVIKEFLELSGISVTIANHGKEALAILETQTFDAVLMDVHMPEMNGFETTQRIRQIEQFKALPVIALTAGVTQEEHQHCLDSGMNDFVAKPIVPEQLISALSRWIRCDSPIVGNWSQTNKLTYTDLKMLEGFELNNLLTMLGGNQEKVIQLLLDFKTDMITMPAEIKGCIEQQDLKKACELVHKLKGVASNLGAMTLHKIVQQLESELKAGEFNQATFYLFKMQFDKTIATISTLKISEDKIENVIIDEVALKSIAIEIDEMLAEDDLISQRLLDELKAHLPTDKTEDIVLLSQEIKNINYYQARLVLRRLVTLPDIEE